LKCGGTWVASPAALQRVAEIVKNTRGHRIVVVSATAGTTDALIGAARAAEGGDAQTAQDTILRLSDEHRNLIADALGFESADVLKEIADLTERTTALLQSVAILRECTARTLDAIVSYGERISAPIVAAVLEHRGVKAEALSAEGLVITDDAFGHANPSLEETRARAVKELAPRLKYGSVLPAVEANIPVRILNTFAQSDAGTTITKKADQDGSVVKATTSLGGLGLITVQGAGMSGVPGFAARVFDTAAAERVSVMMISQSSSENSICLVVPDDATDRLKGALEKMFNAELQRHDVEKIDVEHPVAIVAAVGE